MGQTLVKIYEFVGKNGGLPAQMRLAMKTGMAQPKATAAPDTPDVVAKFKAAAQEITGKVPMV